MAKYELYDISKRKSVGTATGMCLSPTRSGREWKCISGKGQTDEVQGVVFTKNGCHFIRFKVDRHFSYSKINRQIFVDLDEIKKFSNFEAQIAKQKPRSGVKWSGM